jgi:predicted nuclease of predicted toxin-antitoxin system
MLFLANENIPLKSILLLRQEGLDIAAVIEDFPGAKDLAVLERAAKEKRILLTFDRDYGELIFRKGLPAPVGVIYFRFDPLTPEEPAAQLMSLLSQPSLVIEGKFTVFERKRVRQRSLR